MKDEQPRWQDLPLGGVIVQAGSAAQYATGGWRAFRPEINHESNSTSKRCVGCLVCWLYCPDLAIIVVNGELNGVDLNHCKGCGICAEVCPTGCISMIEEASSI